MTTARFDLMAAVAARSLAWSVWWGGWLALGELGQRYTPLWAGGVLPIAVWLSSTVVCSQFVDWRRGMLRHPRVLLLTMSAACSGMLWLLGGRHSAWLLVDAAAWGALVVVADRSTRGLLDEGRATAGEWWPAAIGAVAAWIVVNGGPTGIAAWLAFCGVGLVVGSRWRTASSRIPVGMPSLGTSMASGCITWTGGDWLLGSIRCAMLLMMVSLPRMYEWCSVAGWTNNPSVLDAMHLSSMLLPPLLFRSLGDRPSDRKWLAIPMALSVAALFAMPNARGWEAALMLQSVAWGLAHISGLPAANDTGHRAASRPWVRTLAVVVAICAVAYGQTHLNPDALFALQALLGVPAAVVVLFGFLPKRSHRFRTQRAGFTAETVPLDAREHWRTPRSTPAKCGNPRKAAI